MTTISAEMVKQLREKTGAGIMDCKEALAESGSDMEKAVEFLRKKGLATAQKRAGRAMSQGVVEAYIDADGKTGVLAEVNCETDFVAKTDSFKEFAQNIAMHIAAANPPEADPQAVMNQAYTQDPNKTVADYLNEVIAQTGENITIKRFVRFVPQGAAESYIHMGGKIGVLVEFECNPDLGKTDAFKEFAKNIAMHIAATSPLGIVPEDVPQEVVDKEKEIYRAQALQTGKPEKMLDKIAEGKLGKFFKDVCLMNQAYVKDPNKTVANYLKEVVSQAGGDITIKRFARFQLGE